MVVSARQPQAAGAVLPAAPPVAPHPRHHARWSAPVVAPLCDAMRVATTPRPRMSRPWRAHQLLARRPRPMAAVTPTAVQYPVCLLCLLMPGRALMPCARPKPLCKARTSGRRSVRQEAGRRPARAHLQAPVHGPRCGHRYVELVYSTGEPNANLMWGVCHVAGTAAPGGCCARCGESPANGGYGWWWGRQLQ